MSDSTTGPFGASFIAVKRCCDAWNRTITDLKDKGKTDYDAVKAAGNAYRLAMPFLCGEDHIRGFIACVAEGMILGAINEKLGTKLVYTAQVALSSLPREPRPASSRRKPPQPDPEPQPEPKSEPETPPDPESGPATPQSPRTPAPPQPTNPDPDPDDPGPSPNPTPQPPAPEPSASEPSSSQPPAPAPASAPPALDSSAARSGSAPVPNNAPGEKPRPATAPDNAPAGEFGSAPVLALGPGNAPNAGFVTGHDFSRAERKPLNNIGLQPLPRHDPAPARPCRRPHQTSAKKQHTPPPPPLSQNGKERRQRPRNLRHGTTKNRHPLPPCFPSKRGRDRIRNEANRAVAFPIPGISDLRPCVFHPRGG